LWGWEMTVFIVMQDDPLKKCEFCGETAKAGELWGSGLGPREHVYHHMCCWNKKHGYGTDECKHSIR